MQNYSYDALALFSGGLDSILAARLVMAQGLKVKCLHFTSPFFGKAESVKAWSKIYGLDIDRIDISEDFIQVLRKPQHGIGSVLNPCIDCKITMLRHAASLLEHYGARFLISGEVLGQRPMSQRRDALNIILRDAGVKDLLLRPLSAKVLPASYPERAGLIERERLMGISGRGRKPQLAYAAQLGITKIPSPAGGCLLTERENARSFWQVLHHVPDASAAEFMLSQTGRQYWSFYGGAAYWLCIGRNRMDNEALQKLTGAQDISFKLRDFSGPLALAREFQPWTEEALYDAAAFVASFSSKATEAGEQGPVYVRVHRGASGLDGPGLELAVTPGKNTVFSWSECNWDESRAEIREHYMCSGRKTESDNDME